MKKLTFWILPLAFLGSMGGTWGVGYAQDDQLRKDIDSHMVELRQAEAAFDRAQADLASAKQDMTAMQIRAHGEEEMQALRTRMEKDRADVETYTTRMLSDISFLQNQWSNLSESERDTVKRASQGLE